ncbi:MMPL family transporter [Streptomyces sp. AV19]|uniref:MMPL family transporter n=1 Tax=Streptomyces sp. AV19 TaxID=2793068 RepID=UPI0018FE776E|nr:MMPL family transporter [Streptomyces sp. AV19]MBH1934178.1 MMPL family transporter [Streptomyces sp. AV19]MDG4533559.1 MMPL family transporter [Streptomyces sp. AV19]
MFDRVIASLHRRRVAVLWVSAVLLVLAGIGGLGVEHRLAHGGLSDPGAQSSRAGRLVSEHFPSADDDLVLLLRGAGPVDSATMTSLGTELTRRAERAPGVRAATSYWTAGRATSMRSRDASIGLVSISLRGDEDTQAKTAERLVPDIRRHAEGLTVMAAGPAQVLAEVGKRTAHDLLLAEAISAPVTLVLLLLFFGSAVAAALPLVIALLSILVGRAVVNALAGTVSISVYSINSTTALGLGLAIDYSLFILARFREELSTGATVQEALGPTMRRAGRTVAFSALTVALSLVGLLVFPQFFLRSFAYGGIVVILSAAAGAVLVLPALLAVLGHRVNRYDVFARLRGPAPHTASESGRWYRFATAVMRRPVLYGGGVVVLLAALASPFTGISPGLVDDRTLPADAQVHRAAQLLRERFDADALHTVPVVVEGVGHDRDRLLESYARSLSAVRDVRRVTTTTGTYLAGRRVQDPVPAAATLMSGGHTLLFVVSSVEQDSSAGTQLVGQLRKVAPPGEAARAWVGGRAAELKDGTAAVSRAAPLAIGIVVGSSLVLLFLFTGSVLMPVKALALNTLSLTATFGAMVFVFQEGHLSFLVGSPLHTGMLDTTIPILTFCMAFGLSMDYEVFLLSRIRERYFATGDNAESVAFGLQHTGRIITAAAVLVAALLLIFASSGVTLLKLLGVSLALAVLLDATLVRAVLVPSFMRLAGRANWWAPGPLRRLHDRFGLREDEPERDASGPAEGTAG